MTFPRLRSFASLVLIAAALPVAAQDWAKANLAKSPRHGEFVTITEPSGRKLTAWVVYPEIKDKAPVVVMIHEIFGLSDWAREMADELAGAGYIVVEPDMLSGFAAPGKAGLSASDRQQRNAAMMERLHKVPGMGCDPMACPENGAKAQAHFEAAGYQQGAVNPQLGTGRPSAKPIDEHAMMHQQATAPGAAMVAADPGGTSAFPDQGSITKAVSSLPSAQVMADLDAAAEYGKKLPAANGKLYVAGFCWGGGNSFLFATHRKDLSAAFVFYGPPPEVEAMKNITAPVYGFYGEMDARIGATIPGTITAMKAAGKTYVPVTYDGAGHGFMRAGEAPDATAANSAARAAGFRRLVALLGGLH
jgi:carboxymethylenebutenolidase